MRDENMSMSDGLVMRSLLAYPGGLELHIGARTCSGSADMSKDHAPGTTWAFLLACLVE